MNRFMIFIVFLLLTLAMPLGALAKTGTAASKEITFSKENTLSLNDEVSEEAVAKLILEAKKMDSALPSGEPIILFLYTPGGSIQAGLELSEALSAINRPINTVTMFAASMGFQLVQSLGTRYIVRNGILMSHKAFGRMAGEFGGQRPAQFDSRYEFWLERMQEMDAQTVKRTGGKQTIKSYQAAYSPELWRTGTRAVAEGYADEIVSAKCDKTIEGTRDQAFYIMGIKITLIYDACPINTSPIDAKIEFPTTQGLMTLEKFVADGGVFGPACKTSLPGSDNQGYSVYSGSSSSYYSGVGDRTYGPAPQPAAQALKVHPCALDEALTMERTAEAKQKAKEQTDLVKNQIVKVSW